MTTEFLKGVAASTDQKIIFTPEYRLYYNKETGEVTQIHVTEHNQDSPDGLYIQITADQYKHLKISARVHDQKLVYPKQNSKVYNLVPADTGYGTIKNNPYIVGTEDYYEYNKEFE